ncbi:MAG: MarR family transcriptional regulator [Spirochaetales bacterium]|nr:MarR family transcriptional regulator [Spirochaetales bacterium]
MKQRNRDYGQDDNRHLRMEIGITRNFLEGERGMQTFLKSYGLTLPQFGVLEALYHLGEMRVCDIIEKTLSTNGNMTVVLKNLERDGMILRKPDEADRRASIIGITSVGAGLVEEIFPVHLQNLREKYSSLDGQEKDQLIHLLKKLSGRAKA